MASHKYIRNIQPAESHGPKTEDKFDRYSQITANSNSGIYNVHQHMLARNQIEMASMSNEKSTRSKSEEGLKEYQNEYITSAMRKQDRLSDEELPSGERKKSGRTVAFSTGYIPPLTPSNIHTEVNPSGSGNSQPKTNTAERAITQSIECNRACLKRTMRRIKTNFKRHFRIILPCSIAAMVVVLTILMISVSFVYVEHHQVALLRSKTTGSVQKTPTYYPGCYMRRPHMDFVYFSNTGYWYTQPEFSVFTSGGLEVNLSINMLYYPRAEEIGQLYTLYGNDYRNVLERIITATIKNAAAPLTLDQLRLERAEVEKILHNTTWTKLNDFHVDLTYFWLGKVNIPERVTERLLNSLLIQVRSETEIHKQEHAMVEIITEEITRDIQNQANEITGTSNALSDLFKSRASVTADAEAQNATLDGWNNMCGRLGITDEQHKLSLLYVRSLNQMDNLYMARSPLGGNNYTYTYFPGFDFVHDQV